MTYVQEVTVPISKRLTAEQKKKASDLLEKKRKEDSKIVAGVFKNIESPGAKVEFTYRAHKGEPIRKYSLEDGQTYDLPLGVAKHINNQCQYKKSKYLVNAQGKPIVTDDKPIQRYQFTSTDFL